MGESNGAFSGDGVVIMAVPITGNVKFRVSLECPSALISDNNTVYSLNYTKIASTSPCLMLPVLEPYLNRYTMYCLQMDSLALDGDETKRSSGYIYWANMIVDGAWYGSRPFVVDPLRLCHPYDPDLKLKTDIAAVCANEIAVRGYSTMSRIHLLNSKIFN